MCLLLGLVRRAMIVLWWGEIKDSVFTSGEMVSGISSTAELNKTQGKVASGAPFLFTWGLQA